MKNYWALRFVINLIQVVAAVFFLAAIGLVVGIVGVRLVPQIAHINNPQAMRTSLHLRLTMFQSLEGKGESRDILQAGR